MKNPRLGLAMIINNVERESPGSVADVKVLESAYNTIGFDVRAFNKCSKQVTIFVKGKYNNVKEENYFVSATFVISTAPLLFRAPGIFFDLINSILDI